MGVPTFEVVGSETTRGTEESEFEDFVAVIGPPRVTSADPTVSSPPTRGRSSSSVGPVEPRVVPPTEGGLTWRFLVGSNSTPVHRVLQWSET